MLHVTFSNRSEALLDALLADLDSAPPSSPFTPEHIIVPGAAQRRAVTLALAEWRGVCANVEFSFLAQWLWAQMAHFVPLADASPFAAPALVWRVRELFDDAAFVGRLGALRAYVEDADPLLRYELAREVAALLETYVTYRPEWLAGWSAGEHARDFAGDAGGLAHEAWQAALWARLAGDLGVDRQHPSLAFFTAIERLGPDAISKTGHAGLPERAYFYALASVPPLYLQILKQLARWIDLRLYVLNPCREYWYEIVDRRRLSWLEASGRAEYHEVGNTLLAGWGRQTRAFVDLLLAEGGEEAVIDDERFVEAERGTLLAQVQNAILDLVELEPGSLADLGDDRSIEVHVCHSLSRQLEALRDQLLALFAAADAPLPAEVLVLLPDLDAAAPLIEAVFGGELGNTRSRRIPFAITGRGAETTNAVADLLLRLLALPATRLAADEVFDLLQQPLVARRLRLDDEALLRIHEWMRESGMRWGLDGGQRGLCANSSNSAPDILPPLSTETPGRVQGEGWGGDGDAVISASRKRESHPPPNLPLREAHPEGCEGGGTKSPVFGRVGEIRESRRDFDCVDAFSLRDGLRRLLLGHALPAQGDDGRMALCGGVLPAGDAFGSNAGDLGRLWQFVEALAATLDELRRPRPAAAWPRLLNGILADWTEGGGRLDEEDITQLQAVRAAIDRLDADFATAGATAPLGVEVVRAALADRLEGSAHGGVPTGAVTFSALSAFRGLSARVICLLGLDDGVFPRVHRPAEFDLMAVAPQRGDRQSRDDDRNLFLDLLLGARDRFQLYYNGRSIRDNAPLPPSVLVAELLDTLAGAIAPAAAGPDALKAARARLVVEHPLQSFSLSLFQAGNDARRASYDAETCAAWREALSRERAPAPAPLAGEANDEDDDDNGEAGRGQPFFTTPLPIPGEEWRRVALPRLRAFFRHPARVLLKDRLQVRFDYEEEALPDEDPFGLEWSARRRLWSGFLRSDSPLPGPLPGGERGNILVARAMRLAPAGMVGEVLLEQQLAGIGALAATIAALRQSPRRDDHAFALDVTIEREAWQLHGLLGDLHADGQLVIREDNARGREYLDAWLRHLALNACSPPDVAPVTTLVARNGCLRFAPVADAAARLAELLGFYRDGLSAPLHFYPKAAWAYVDGGESIAKARGVWSSARKDIAGEGDDPWWRLALRGVDEPLDARFAELARAIYGPMLAAIAEMPAS